MKMFMTFFITSLLSYSALAEVGPALSYPDLEKMARTAINDEVLLLNKIVKNYLIEKEDIDQHGYKNVDLKIFDKFNKPDGIEAEILYESCLLTQNTISAVSSTRITRNNLRVTANITNIEGLKKSVNGKFFRIVERACLNSQKRLVERLTNATSKGVPLNLTDEVIRDVTTVVFYPAVYSKPSVGKYVMRALPLLVQTIFILTAASPAVSVAVGATWISLTRITGSGLAIKGMISGPNEIFKQCYIDAVDLKDGIKIDLSEEEAAVAI